MRRARPDLEKPISLLCRKVSKINVDDWKKLKRVVLWVKGTIYDKRIIRAKSLYRCVYMD